MMNKRVSIRRELKKKLATIKHSLNFSHEYNDLVDVMGGEIISDQYIKNLNTDKNDLEFILDCLDKRDKEKIPSLYKDKGINLD